MCYGGDADGQPRCRRIESRGNRIVTKMKLLPFAQAKWHAALFALIGSNLVWRCWLARW
jgi:hypothetical protein